MIRTIKKIDKLMNWTNLRAAVELPFIGSMYIWIFMVPIAAKFMQYAEDTARLTVFGHTFEATLSLPFSWVAFYFSALFFASANLVFRGYCPSIIKENTSFRDFQESKKGLLHLDSYLHEVDMNWEGLRRSVADQDAHFMNNVDVGIEDQRADPLQKEFWSIMHRAMTHSSRARYAAGILYFGGFLLILQVLGQNLGLVIDLWLDSLPLT